MRTIRKDSVEVELISGAQQTRHSRQLYYNSAGHEDTLADSDVMFASERRNLT